MLMRDLTVYNHYVNTFRLELLIQVIFYEQLIDIQVIYHETVSVLSNMNIDCIVIWY